MYLPFGAETDFIERIRRPYPEFQGYSPHANIKEGGQLPSVYRRVVRHGGNRDHPKKQVRRLILLELSKYLNNVSQPYRFKRISRQYSPSYGQGH